MTSIRQRVFSVISKALDCDVKDIDMTTGLLRHRDWDSLAHISIIVGLEEEFQITVPDEEIESLNSVQSICDYVMEVSRNTSHPTA